MDKSKIPKVPVPAPRRLQQPAAQPDVCPSSTRMATRLRQIDNLSQTQKLDLMTTHTKTASFTSAKNGLHTSLTRSTPNISSLLQKRRILAASAETTSKQNKSERKPAQKIPPYDYKARFNDLLEKHKILKEEEKKYKEGFEEVSEENDKLKESLQSFLDENSFLKESLSEYSENLRTVTIEHDRIKLEYGLFDKRLKEALDTNEKLKTTLEKIKNELQASLLESKEAHFQLSHRSEELRHIKEEYEAEVRKNNRLNSLYDTCQTRNMETDMQLRTLQTQFAETEKQSDEKCVIISGLKKDNESLQNILDSMYKEQKDLRNTVQDLRGNIRVFCRIRPPLKSEDTKPLFCMRITDSCTMELEKISLNSQKRPNPQNFTFDGIFSAHASQSDVFAEVSPMIQSALDGYNVCIFAYGQTGSGKTFTMEGGSEPDKFGIIPRAFDMIFTYADDLKRMGWDLTIRASFLEIYNETIYDLLEPKKNQDDHEIKMVDQKGNEVYVSNLKEAIVKSSYDFTRLMITAQRNRQTAATLCNERSSRSHSVAQIRIFAINEKRKEKFNSNLNLVDLAGSESGKTTQRMDETKHINRSLSDLSKVILALQTNQSHIPYRNSKLTYLLMPSLGGNSKTLMMVNVSQFDECYLETLNSLRFAVQVNNCKSAKVKKNITTV